MRKRFQPRMSLYRKLNQRKKGNQRHKQRKCLPLKGTRKRTKEQTKRPSSPSKPMASRRRRKRRRKKSDQKNHRSNQRRNRSRNQRWRTTSHQKNPSFQRTN